jgi:alkylated DNA repair dioxygenase AlkB
VADANQFSLFDAAGAHLRVVRLDLPDAEIDWCPDFIAAEERDDLFDAVRATTAWEQASVRMYGRETPIPRLQAWYGDDGKAYAYSGIAMDPQPWTAALQEIRDRLDARLGRTFNSVLANLYRDGRDSVGWHADDEPELGAAPVIASVSLGATRTFQLRHNDDPQLRHAIELTPGSLLVMRGPTQHRWRHQLPKTSRPVGERINLTYRTIV